MAENQKNDDTGNFMQGIADEFNVTPDIMASAPSGQEDVEEVVQIKVGDRIIQGKDYQEIVEQLAQEQEELLAQRNYQQYDHPEPEEPYFPQYERAPMSAEEEFILAQSLQSQPVTAIERAAEEIYGLTAEEIREAVMSIREIQSEIAGAKVGAEFARDHRNDYAPTPRNASLMEEFLINNKLPATRGNLEYALNKLSRKLDPVPQKTAEKRENLSVTTGLSDSLNGGFEDSSIPNVEKLSQMSSRELETWIKGEEARRRGNPALNY